MEPFYQEIFGVSEILTLIKGIVKNKANTLRIRMKFYEREKFSVRSVTYFRWRKSTITYNVFYDRQKGSSAHEIYTKTSAVHLPNKRRIQLRIKNAFLFMSLVRIVISSFASLILIFDSFQFIFYLRVFHIFIFISGACFGSCTHKPIYDTYAAR